LAGSKNIGDSHIFLSKMKKLGKKSSVIAILLYLCTTIENAKYMTSTEKTAIARIITDLIKADDILDLYEMKLFREIREKYHIEESHLKAAHNIDFGTAVANLKTWTKEQLSLLFNDMKSITVADGNCCQEEALLILALRYCLSEEHCAFCRLISTDVTNVTIDKGYVVYVESDYDKATNTIIQDNFRNFTNEFRIAGLEFVYIPRIAHDFSEMSEDYLMDIVKFLAPSLSENKRENVFNTLRNISTKNFCDDLLVKKMGLNEIYDTEPSIIMQVSRTDKKIVYLQICFDDDIQSEIETFVDDFKELTAHMQRPIQYSRPASRFIYYGFHKSLFDIIAFPGQKIESRILIDLLKRCIVFIDLDESLYLPPMQLAQYAFILQQTICSKTHELPAKPASDVRKKALNKTFNHIYGLMDGDKDTDYNKNLSPNISHIKKAISQFEQLDNLDAYLPEKTEDKTYRIRIKPSNVFVMENGKPVLMTESERWTRDMNC